MSSTVDNSAKRGHILLLSTMTVTLVAPLALIILSYISLPLSTLLVVAS